MKKEMKNENFGKSVICALRGLKNGFKSERNFKIYFLIAFVFLIFNILLSSELYDYVLLFFLTCTVFALEYVNTSIERVVDRFSEGIDEDCKFIKDVAAGAVLVMGIAFFGIEGILLISRLIPRLIG